jgi:hypothetical protein
VDTYPDRKAKHLQLSAADISSTRGLAWFLLILGAIMAVPAGSNAVQHSVRRSTFLEGGQFGLGLIELLLGALILCSALHTRQHLNAPPAYWQAFQDCWRPRILLIFACAGTFCLLAGMFADSRGASFVGGTLLGVGCPAIAIAVAMLTGGVAPVVYE